MVQCISEFSKVVNALVKPESDLPDLLLGIIVAYLTILISVAIAIFSENKKEFETLDRNVILDHIIKAKSLLFYLGLTFLPLLFWNNSLWWTRLLEIIIWCVGVFFITKILINSYRWMKGNKFKLRFDYLRNLQNKQDIEEAWRSVWQTASINSQNEQEFINIFYSSVNRLFEKVEKDDLIIVSKLLGDFSSFIDKRSSFILTWQGEVLDRLLQWHFEMWEKEHEYLNEDNKEKVKAWAIYSGLSRNLDLIFQHIETRALKERNSFLFFDKLKKHAEKYKKKSISSFHYSRYLCDSFYKVLFENIHDAPEKFDVWEHYFPKEWKITKNNLQDSENIISSISYKIFMNWAMPRIMQTKEEYDFTLDEVSSELFPEVDPILWSKILIFVFSPYSDVNDKLRYVIEKRWTFGSMGRAKAYSGEDELSKMYKDEEINTFDLACFLFQVRFSKINLETYIEMLEKFSYAEGSKEESKRLRMHNLFAQMLNFMKNAEPPS